MITVLFDLDDTLINNNAEQFTRVYLGLLGKYLQQKIDSKIMVPALLKGTRKMIEKNVISGTLEETFDNYFYPKIGLSKSDIANLIHDFYQNVFPILQSETSPRPDAVEIVKECLSRGWKVAVATNPLFPIAAVHHRLKWAGLNPDEVPFEVITSFESFHFAKPQPAFFAEVAARVDIFDQPIVMIGNDLKDDIIPAVNTGVPSYWLLNNNDDPSIKLPENCVSGEMSEIIPWLEGIEAKRDQIQFKSSSSLLAALSGNAAALDWLVRNTSKGQWNVRPSDTEWNITEILCHLRDVDSELNLPRIKTILTETQPFIAGVETDRWASERNYAQQDGKLAWRSFLDTRQQIISVLEKVSEHDWRKGFKHTIFGPSTLMELVEIIVAHDSNHFRQITKLVK